MTVTRRQPTACTNLNHLRANSPVPHCPQCGAVVNRDIPRRQCNADEHAVSRRQGSVFCVRCGTQLILNPA